MLGGIAERSQSVTLLPQGIELLLRSMSECLEVDWTAENILRGMIECLEVSICLLLGKSIGKHIHIFHKRFSKLCQINIKLMYRKMFQILYARFFLKSPSILRDFIKESITHWRYRTLSFIGKLSTAFSVKLPLNRIRDRFWYHE